MFVRITTGILIALLPHQAARAEDDAIMPMAFEPLPLGQIAPDGWLRTQLRIQADGLTGHLDEFWPDVRDSGWIGGEAEGWERAPYWLDGLVPLAYLLDDPGLKAKVNRWFDYILEHQLEDGWFGPEHGKRGGNAAKSQYDPWPVFIILKSMTQYYEATGDARVIPAMLRCAKKLNAVLDETPLFEWGRHRWMDGAVSMLWLYDRTDEEWPLDVARKLHEQGFDWQEHFTTFPYHDRLNRDQLSMDTHVVNNAMGVKAPAVWYRVSKDPAAKDALYAALENLDRYHGQATGLFTGDEHLAGKNPSQGTELCAVVEYMYSLETAISIVGDPVLADRLERIAFNALPATFKPDMWAHQYDQQANQPVACVAEKPIYTSNGSDANLFGLEPNYGCCTSNYHQGWPKFASHLWMKSPDEGLAAVAYAPCTVRTDVRGVPVVVTVDTEYPFRDSIAITVHADAPVEFPLHLRIPSWASSAQVVVGEEPASNATAGTFHTISRRWEGKTVVTLRLPMEVRAERRYHNAVSISRGPLVYALRIDEDWRQLRGDLPHADWEVFPRSPWNYALQIDTDDLSRDMTFEEQPIGNMPFSPEGAPVHATVSGRQVPEWTLIQDAAGPIPQSPVHSDEPLTDLTLIPYGCTNLRITEFPVLDTRAKSAE